MHAQTNMARAAAASALPATMLAAVLSDPLPGSDDVKGVTLVTVHLPTPQNCPELVPPTAGGGGGDKKSKAAASATATPAAVTSTVDRVLIRVSAAALNRRDDFCRRGMYPGPLPNGQTLGADACGVVVDVWMAKTPPPAPQTNFKRRRDLLARANAWKRDATRVLINPTLWFGDGLSGAQTPQMRVLGQWPLPGCFAEYVVVPIDRVHAVPPHLTDAEAAALPLVGATAWRALVTQGGVPVPPLLPADKKQRPKTAKQIAEKKQGSVVLIPGIGSGVAVMALQFAVAMGCRVFVTSSSKAKIARAVQMGAVAGFDYTDNAWEQRAKAALRSLPGPQQVFDVVVDGAAGPALNAYVKLMRPGGTMVSYGGTAGPPPAFNVFALFLQQLQWKGTAMCSDAEFERMLAFVSAHKIRPVVDREYASLHELVPALDRMRTGAQFGKLVVRVAPPPGAAGAGTPDALATPRSKL